MNDVKLCPIVVLISGNGSNLQALINSEYHGKSYQIVGVISNKADAIGLQRALHHDIETRVVDHTQYQSREDYDAELSTVIDQFQPELIALAGFMRILTADFVNKYSGRMVNIHPSLLPAYQGLHTHRRAIADKATQHGTSIHFVTEELDGGPIIIQAKIAIEADDTETSLAEKVLTQEHIIYPKVVNWFALEQLHLEVGKIYFQNNLLDHPMIL